MNETPAEEEPTAAARAAASPFSSDDERNSILKMAIARANRKPFNEARDFAWEYVRLAAQAEAQLGEAVKVLSAARGRLDACADYIPRTPETTAANDVLYSKAVTVWAGEVRDFLASLEKHE